MNSKTITSRRERDGSYSQLTDSGWVKEAPMSEIGARFPVGEPVYDPENPPLTKEQLSRMRRVSPAKHIRFQLGLTQEQFAETYMIPIGTLRDWEQHRSEPDAPARAYLKVIAADPEGVARTLGASARPAAE